MRRNNGPETAKSCPFIEHECLKEGCQIYNERLNRCEIGLMAYNLFLLSDVMKRPLEDANKNAEVGMK